jgi:CRISPR/Cas system-associated protein Cas7 (RAMP superfamily)
VGTQFQLNYDNTKLKFERVDFTANNNAMNYGTNRGNFISIGSLITNGNGVLDKNTEYKVLFTPIGSINSILGLTSVSTTDAVNKDGKQLKVKVN